MIGLLLFIAVVAGIVYFVKHPEKLENTQKVIHWGAKRICFALAFLFLIVGIILIINVLNSDFENVSFNDAVKFILLAIFAALLACLSAILSIWLHLEEKVNT